jgi:Skp family chaperone for outer membrane proteins
MKKIFTLFVIGMLFVNSTEAKSINKLNFININVQFSFIHAINAMKQKIKKRSNLLNKIVKNALLKKNTISSKILPRIFP